MSRARRSTSAVRAEVCADALVTRDGPFVLVRPETPAAHRWLRKHVAGESTWSDGQLVVEPRYAPELVEAMRGAGLEVTT